MKDMKPWIIVVLMSIALGACKQDIDLYEGGSSIYFDDNTGNFYEFAWGPVDSEIKTMKINLRVNLMGQVTDYPRKFNIRVISSESDSLHSVAGVDYTPFPLEYEIPAMQEHTYITIELLRTDTLKKQARQFTVQLLANEELGLDFLEYDEADDGTLYPVNNYCTVYMNEEFPRPWWWWSVGEDIFGEWSQTKGILICDVGNIDRAKFQGEIDGIDDHLSEPFLRFVGRKVHLWLQDNPTKDEDGEWMEMGDDSTY